MRSGNSCSGAAGELEGQHHVLERGERRCRKRRIARRAVGDQGAIARRADHGQRRGAGMGAAFGAPRYMDGQRVAQIRGGGSGNIRGDGSRGDVSGCTERRAGASDNMPARIVGACDKA